MRRSHRRSHLVMWLIVGPLALIGLIVGVASRSRVPAQEPPAVDQAPDSMPPAKKVTGQ